MGKLERTESVRQAREDRDERAGGATMLQPLMSPRRAAAFAAARPGSLGRSGFADQLELQSLPLSGFQEAEVEVARQQLNHTNRAV